MSRQQVESACARRCYAAAIAVVLGALMAACSAPSQGPEAEIRAWLERGVAAAEAKDRREILDMISPAYADARGNNRARIGDVLRVYFLRMNSIELITTVNEITVMADTAAEVALSVAMAGTKDSLLGFSADAYRFSFELEKTAGDWLLISAQWGQIGEDLK